MKILFEIKDIGVFPLPLGVTKLTYSQLEELETELVKTFKHLHSAPDLHKLPVDEVISKTAALLNMCAQNYINKVNRDKQVPSLLIPKR